jgi:hypothetical protein
MREKGAEGVLAAGYLLEDPAESQFKGPDVARLNPSLLGARLVGAWPALRCAWIAFRLFSIASLPRSAALVTRSRYPLALDTSWPGRGRVELRPANGNFICTGRGATFGRSPFWRHPRMRWERQIADKTRADVEDHGRRFGSVVFRRGRAGVARYRKRSRLLNRSLVAGIGQRLDEIRGQRQR